MKSIGILFVVLTLLTLGCTPRSPNPLPPVESLAIPSPMPPIIPSPTPTPAPTLTSEPSIPLKSPHISIALDYFGIRNTHWIPQVGGDPLAKIQLVMVVSDEKQNLAVRTIPPEGIPGFDTDFFQVKAVGTYMDPVVFTGSSTGSLTVYVAAYNVNKGPVTKAQIDILGKWLGFPGLEILKSAVPDRELIGHYWHTWSPSSNLGIGRHDEQGEGDLRVWLRIWSDEMPASAQQPVLKPNVRIEGVKLPTGVKVRQPSEQFFFNTWHFEFTIANYESFEFPVYWHLESSSSPETEGVYQVHPTDGKVNIHSNGKVTIEAWYWFKTLGDYIWKYVLEYPKGSSIHSWEGILKVSS